MTRYAFTPILLLGCLMAACNIELEDSRDNADNVEADGFSKVDFAYTLKYSDYFDSYINTMQYFLFDADGNYMGQLYGEDDDPSVVSLDGLTAGTYSLVGIGNLDDYATIAGLSNGLSSLSLVVSQLYDGDTANESTAASPIYANGDNIYWGQCDFTLDSTSTTQCFTGELSSLHCQLLVRVVWEDLPDYSDGYAFELIGIGLQTELNNANATTLSYDQQFPPVSLYSGRMREDVPLRQFALQAYLYTLRYTDDNIPTLRILHDGEPVISDIDLAYVFDQWGWTPSSAWAQEYQMLVTIREDGYVELSVSVTGNVNDWENGGTLG